MIGASPSIRKGDATMYFTIPDLLVILCLVLLAVAIVWAARRAPTRSGAQQAYRRGAEYALAELFLSDDQAATADRLEAEADSGSSLDPSPFDDAIRDVLKRRELFRLDALTDARLRLEAMVDLGEASQSEVSVATNLLDEMLETRR